MEAEGGRGGPNPGAGGGGTLVIGALGGGGVGITGATGARILAGSIFVASILEVSFLATSV